MQPQLPEGWTEQPSYASFKFVYGTNNQNGKMYTTAVYEGRDGWFLMSTRKETQGPFDTPRAAMLAHRMLESSKRVGKSK